MDNSTVDMDGPTEMTFDTEEGYAPEHMNYTLTYDAVHTGYIVDDEGNEIDEIRTSRMTLVFTDFERCMEYCEYLEENCIEYRTFKNNELWLPGMKRGDYKSYPPGY